MSWWWDTLNDDEAYYRQYAPVATLVQGVRFDQEGFERLTVVASPEAAGVVASVLRGKRTVLVWLKDSAHQWTDPNDVVQAGLSLTLEGLSAGSWRAQWIDPWAQTTTAPAPVDVTVDVTVGAEPLSLSVPSFSRDFALRLDFGPAQETTNSRIPSK